MCHITHRPVKRSPLLFNWSLTRPSGMLNNRELYWFHRWHFLVLAILTWFRSTDTDPVWYNLTLWMPIWFAAGWFELEPTISYKEKKRKKNESKNAQKIINFAKLLTRKYPSRQAVSLVAFGRLQCAVENHNGSNFQPFTWKLQGTRGPNTSSRRSVALIT